MSPSVTLVEELLGRLRAAGDDAVVMVLAPDRPAGT